MPNSQPGHFSVPEAVALDPDSPAFAKDASWAVALRRAAAGPPGAAEGAREMAARDAGARPGLRAAARRRGRTGAAGRRPAPPRASAGQAADLAFRLAGLPRLGRPHHGHRAGRALSRASF